MKTCGVWSGKWVTVREFLARSLILVGTASVIGVALSAFLSPALTDLVMPIFGDVIDAERAGPVITPAGVAAAIGAGGVLGTLPVLSALATPIAEGMRA